jgi:four helix bundle protein
MHNFRELRIWKDSMEIAKTVHTFTLKFPKEERYAITQQINKCSVSIPSNIAEGAGRRTKKDFSHFISIAIGSSFELETQLILSGEFDYINKEPLTGLLLRITTLQRMMNKFRDTLN